MPKSLPIFFGALLVVAGCVSVAPEASPPPTSVASAAPSLGVTTPAPPTAAATVAATASRAATVAPTEAATASPTSAPTVGPSAAPSAGYTASPTSVPTNSSTTPPSPGASGEPGTRDLLFSDDFSDPSSGWATLTQDFATISYDAGVLAFRFNTNQSWAVSSRALANPNTTVVVAGDFTPQSDGFFGAMCGDTSSATFFGAVVDTTGRLIFAKIDNGTATVLDHHENLGLNVTVNKRNPLAVECNVDAANGLTITAGLSGTGPVGVYHSDSGTWPVSFDQVELYGEAASDGYTLAVDRAAAFGVGGGFGTMSDGADILYQHIPAALQNNCYESPQFSDAAEFRVTCVEQTRGTGAELARYEQYADNDAMTVAYDDLVTVFGVASTGSCKTGPNEAEWTANEQVGGRVQCAPQAVGIRFDWTDDQSSILSSLIDFEGSYKDTYDQWVNAGPIIPQG